MSVPFQSTQSRFKHFNYSENFFYFVLFHNTSLILTFVITLISIICQGIYVSIQVLTGVNT